MEVDKTDQILDDSYAYIFEPQHENSNNAFVRPSKTQTSLRIGAVWSEALLVSWIFYDLNSIWSF